jgi:hypothetical protein
MGDASNMIFTQEDEVIQGVFAKCLVETFYLGIRIARVVGGRDSLDVQYMRRMKLMCSRGILGLPMLLVLDLRRH